MDSTHQIIENSDLLGISSEIKTTPARSMAAIIPAYNEASRIRQVLQVLHLVKQLGEIIVVDDGSMDATAQYSRLEAETDPRIRIIVQPTNMGKGQAVFTGWQASRAPFLIMLDADLFGLKPQHIEDLYQPVLNSQADMTIGVFRGGYWKTDISHWATPWLSGQRCFRADLLKAISWDAAAGYGLETALTVAARMNGWIVRKVPWQGAWHMPSESRRGFWRGAGMKGKMYLQIIRAWYVAGNRKRWGVDQDVSRH